MPNPLPIICIPGLGCTPRLYAEQIPYLWAIGPVTIAQHTQFGSMREIAQSILANAPERFALVGLSMGGYVSFEIVRQAPERVVKLALLGTSARPDAPEQSVSRKGFIKLAETTTVGDLMGQMYPRLVHKSRHDDNELRQILCRMGDETGTAAYIRQQTAIMGRSDSRPLLSTIRCPTLVIVGDSDELTPPAIASEIANGIPSANLVEVPDCGHSSALEQPGFVTRTLVKFLNP